MSFGRSALVAFFVFVSFLNAAAQPYCSIYNTKPIYDEKVKHFEKINPSAPKGGTLHFSWVGTFDHLNPFIILGTHPVLVNMLCFARLMENSPEEIGVFYPYLANAIKISEDKKTITFYLNENATFSDDTPITADDVVWSFEYLIKASPQMKQYYSDVAGVKALDKHTVEFTSKNPSNKELPSIISQIFIFSKQYFEKNMPESGAITNPFPVSGPYKIAKVDGVKTLVFERVKNWWGEKVPCNVGNYNFEKVQLDYYRDDKAAFQAFLGGSANVWFEASAKQWNTAYEVSAVKQGNIKKKILVGDKIARTGGFAFNLRKEKFKDIRVRKAITLLFNFQSLNKAVFYNEYNRLDSYYGSAELAHTGKPAGLEKQILEPFKEQLPTEVFGDAFKNRVYEQDLVPREVVKEALDLLQEAGWTITDQKLVNAKGEVFEITIPFAVASIERAILHLQRNFQTVGIKVIPRQLDLSTYAEVLDQFDYDMCSVLIPQPHMLGNEQREYFGSKAADIKGSQNYAGIKNPVIDKLIEQLISAQDYETMLTTAHAIDRVLCWNYYILLGWDFHGARTAYWDKFGMPKETPKYQTVPIFSWWALPDAAVKTETSAFNIASMFEKIKAWFR
jgi:microcin C transport system substrate-binding protein